MSGNDGGDYYAVLGVEAGADAEEITAAYRDQVKETHPDVSDAADAAAQFRRVARAHEVLSDPVERRRYDRLGHEEYRADSLSRTTGASAPADPTPPSRSEDGSRSPHAERRDPAAHSDGSSTDAAGAGDTTPGSLTWGAARWLRFAAALLGAWQQRLTPSSAAIAMGVFVAYPAFLISSMGPFFPLSVRVTVGVCTFLLVGYLVTRPEIGLPVFGGWAIILPVALTVGGVGLVSAAGVLVLVFTVGPLVVTLVTFGGASV